MRNAPVRAISQIKFATIHHAAVLPGAPDLRTLKRRAFLYDESHARKPYAIKTDGKFGYDFISYHWMIDKQGNILQVQDPKFVRFHAGDNARGSKSHNLWGIAILVDGHFDKEVPTDQQLESAAKIIYDFEERIGRRLEIKAHGEVSIAATSCAGKFMGKSIEIGSRLNRIVALVNQSHQGQQPPPDIGSRKDELLYVLEYIKQRRETISNPERHQELDWLKGEVEKRINNLP